MKKFTAAVTALHEAETSAKSELQKSYTEYFSAKLNKFGAKSPADLSPEQKSEFFSEISKDWERGVGAKPAGKKDVEEHGVKESEEVNEGKEIKSDSEFKEYAQTVLKKAFGDKYDEDKAMKTAEGILKKADGDYGAAVGMLTSSLGESEEVNEGKEIKSDSEFKEYAQTVLKKAFGDKYDEEKAMKTAEGILKKADGDYGAAVGMLTSSLGESKDVNEAATCSMCGKEDCECYKEKDTNESVNVLNEGTTLYISDPKFKDEASLRADILKNAGPALNDLLSRQGIKYNPLSAADRRGERISFESKPMTGKDLGFMQYGFKEVYINIFSGGNYPQINKAAGESFEFKPFIWATLNYSYQHTLGGSNGCGLVFPGEQGDSIYYDVVAGKWLTNSEAGRRSDWK